MSRVLAIEGDNQNQASTDFLFWRREIKMASFAATFRVLTIVALADQI